VAVIGLGAMGLPMATRLAEDLTVQAFDPDAARLAEAREQGVVAAATPRAAAADADVVVLAVRDAAQVEAALFGVDGAIDPAATAAQVVVLTSTVGRDAARAVERAVHEATDGGVGVVDAPVSGGPARAGAGDLLVVVGADPQARERARPVLGRLASTLTVVGDRVGDGQVVKTINQLLAGVHIAAAAEAIALTRELGLDPEVIVPLLSTGAAGSFMLADRGPRMAQAYTGGAPVRSRVDIFVKDMGLVTELARSAHVPTPLAASAQQLYLMAEQAGLGAQDDSSVVTLLSAPDGGAA